MIRILNNYDNPVWMNIDHISIVATNAEGLTSIFGPRGALRETTKESDESLIDRIAKRRANRQLSPSRWSV